MSQLFVLQPFPGSSAPQAISLTAKVTRQANSLVLAYTVIDRLAQIDLPMPSDSPTRRDNLWQMTCFEFFVAAREATPYREFNLSPSGNWNVYRFESYRQGWCEEEKFSALPFRADRQADVFTLDVNIDLEKIIPPNQPLQAGIAAVIKTKRGDMSYWAITHRGEKPDFHLRKSFIADLPGF